ncbi:hypothetical protein ACFWWT_47710 [Streptomyces sp. NPDC058676]
MALKNVTDDSFEQDALTRLKALRGHNDTKVSPRTWPSIHRS